MNRSISAELLRRAKRPTFYKPPELNRFTSKEFDTPELIKVSLSVVGSLDDLTTDGFRSAADFVNLQIAADFVRLHASSVGMAATDRNSNGFYYDCRSPSSPPENTHPFVPPGSVPC